MFGGPSEQSLLESLGPEFRARPAIPKGRISIAHQHMPTCPGERFTGVSLVYATPQQIVCTSWIYQSPLLQSRLSNALLPSTRLQVCVSSSKILASTTFVTSASLTF